MNIVLVFDEGPGAGLGHRRRMEALAAELDGRGHECVLSPVTSEAVAADVAIVDSYRVRADDAGLVRAGVVIAIDDLSRDLAVDVLVDPSPGADGHTHHRAGRVLAGAAYALVPVPSSGAVGAPVDSPVERLLVTTGAADAAGVGARLATAVRAMLPKLEVRLVVGPWGASDVPDGVVVVDAPDGLADELAAASIVVTAGGVTMLEACLLGRPVVALALAENQRQAVSALARDDCVVEATLETVAETVRALVSDRGRRIALSAAAGAAVDGKGATRVADAIEQLVAR